MSTSTSTITFDDETMFNLKQILKKKGIKPTVQNVINYALKLTINAHNTLDEETLCVIS